MLGRNTLRGPGFYNFDFSVFRDIPISERLGMFQIRFEAFNLTNHTNFGVPNLNSAMSLNANPFAQITSAFPSRQIQFAGKWEF